MSVSLVTDKPGTKGTRPTTTGRDPLGMDPLGSDPLGRDPLQMSGGGGETEPPRPTTLAFHYDLDAHMRYASDDPNLRMALNHIQSFQDTDTKAGVTLTNIQKAALTIQVLTKCGVSFEDQETVLTKIFFGHGDGHDEISNIQVVPGGYQITFFQRDAMGVQIQPLFLDNPPVFTGKDDNLRAKKVQSAKRGFRGTNYMRVATSPDSVWAIHRADFEKDFLRDKGKAWATVSEAERHADPEFQEAFDGYLEILQLDYVKKIGNFGVEIVAAFRDEQLAAGLPVDGKALAERALNFVLNYKDPELYLEAHTDLRVEDEAVAEYIMQQLGYVVKFNADNLKDIQVISGPPAPKAEAATAEEASPPGPWSWVIRREIGHAEKHPDTLNIGEDSAFYTSLPPEAQAIVSKLWAAPSVQHEKVVDHVDLYKAMLTKWLAVVEAQESGQGADAVDALQKEFQAALDAFVSANTKKVGGVTIG